MPRKTSKGMPDEHEFADQLQEYTSSLHHTKQNRTLVDRATYHDLIDYLSGDDDNMREPRFRQWADKFFSLRNAPRQANVIELVAGPQDLPVARTEDLYEILVRGHSSHGGRDKTSAAVRSKWSYIPKDVVGRFVKICPTCQSRRAVVKAPRLPVRTSTTPEPPARTASATTPPMLLLGLHHTTPLITQPLANTILAPVQSSTSPASSLERLSDAVFDRRESVYSYTSSEGDHSSVDTSPPTPFKPTARDNFLYYSPM
ncbi:uncharacterized protein L969DRAFT_50619 [Mixia osmundae IAM 14324]|uniref:Integrase zinc-binding domain-containing protein n=1 Tax=Mixia osmundae (strain CBS 9802 / IAM 14324 / JCM 22182 / KY 12970) TaxID=764103 RepID=G7E716_MIXOS|nr:uncharacterized protein L969DRAFT_50619 [Mixia osmundae IAM 14324]KEI38992.1 hypothetical protein L969DRAFT_50619 [Mixia osmundae IAM 14324]GAA98626.1 hypothetical protein E5Q_05313 [Mixia osmundae IAM 14324]